MKKLLFLLFLIPSLSWAGNEIISVLGTDVSSSEIVDGTITSSDLANSSIVLSGGTITGTLVVGNGGTGQTTFTNGGILLGTGASAIHSSAVLTEGQILVGDGTTDPSIVVISGLFTMGSNGVATINNNTITNGAMTDDAIGAAEIAADAVGSSEIATNAVGELELASSSVNTAELIDGSVTTIKILDGTILFSDFGQNSATGRQKINWTGTAWNADSILLGDIKISGSTNNVVKSNGTNWVAGSVAFSEITGNVTGAMISNGTVDSADIAQNAIRSWHIASETIDSSDIKDGTVSWADASSQFKDSARAGSGGGTTVTWDSTSGAGGSWTRANITVIAGTNITISRNTWTDSLQISIPDATTTVKGAASFATANFAVSSGAVTIKTDGVTSTEIAANAVGNSEMADNAIGTAEITNATIDSVDIAQNAIRSYHILDSTITGADIKTNTIDSQQLAPNCILTSELASNCVTSAKVLNGTLTGSDVAASGLTCGSSIFTGSWGVTFGGTGLTSVSIGILQSSDGSTYSAATGATTTVLKGGGAGSAISFGQIDSTQVKDSSLSIYDMKWPAEAIEITSWYGRAKGTAASTFLSLPQYSDTTMNVSSGLDTGFVAYQWSDSVANVAPTTGPNWVVGSITAPYKCSVDSAAIVYKTNKSNTDTTQVFIDTVFVKGPQLSTTTTGGLRFTAASANRGDSLWTGKFRPITGNSGFPGLTLTRFSLTGSNWTEANVPMGAKLVYVFRVRHIVTSTSLKCYSFQIYIHRIA